MPPKNHHILRQLTYLAAFLFTIHLAFPAYVNSSFLSTLLDEDFVGLVFAIAALITICGIYLLPRFLSRNGVLSTTALLAVLNIGAAFILVKTESAFILIAAFIFYYVVGLLMKYNLDLYLEHLSENSTTGQTRGIYLTAINLAWILSPFIVSRAVSGGNFSDAYLISGLILLPVAYLALYQLKEFRSTPYPEIKAFSLIKKLWQHKTEKDHNIYNILVIDFLLNLFFATMVIYMPLYLHLHLGLPILDLGIIFTIMLVPFLIFTYPVGQLADRLLGEKEILTAGLIIAGVSTFLVPFITSTTILAWGVLLFMTRVGASLIETTKEIYLFKQIDPSDAQILTLSRIMLPLSYLIGPILGTLIVLIAPLQFLFSITGVILIAGIYFSLRLVDTR
jgi:hypothetical protein